MRGFVLAGVFSWVPFHGFVKFKCTLGPSFGVESVALLVHYSGSVSISVHSLIAVFSAIAANSVARVSGVDAPLISLGVGTHTPLKP